MNPLERIKLAIRDQNYRISSHANEEMSEDDLDSNDLENVIKTGKVKKRFTKDPRGTRFEVKGIARDHREAFVVCRFLESGKLLIITAYTEN